MLLFIFNWLFQIQGLDVIDYRWWVENLLGPISGIGQQLVMAWLLSELLQGINIGGWHWIWDPSPRGKRYFSIFLAVLFPTVLYVVVGNWIFGWWGFEFATWISDIGTAFLASQLLHGVTKMSKEVTVAPPDGYSLVGLTSLPSSTSVLAAPHTAPFSSMNPPFSEQEGEMPGDSQINISADRHVALKTTPATVWTDEQAAAALVTDAAMIAKARKFNKRPPL
jgi:hypothetical protein